ncbi:MAG: TlpA family protein disulfide reductase [Bacteroidia bacterium]|nr:TlpA family protein disulfide reductase [Bacteroidia bacterium]MCF8427876.1 TlpA family protein disulfide reductase [Bacteroidia bacterium]MCF8447277.1 TlpA family protein disulfide reductase [Bacteroidia bacterium]
MKIFSAIIEKNYKEVGDLDVSRQIIEISKIKNDSFYLYRRTIGGKLVNYIIEEKDSIYSVEINLQNSTFSIFNNLRIPYSRNFGEKSNRIKQIFGMFLDSSYSHSLYQFPKDTIIYGIPCWELIRKPIRTSFSNLIESSIFISKGDYYFRGFREVDVYEDTDTVINSSFIKTLNFDISEVRYKIKLLTDSLNYLIFNYSQKPLETFKLQADLYSGHVNSISAYCIQNQDSILLDFKKGRYLLDFWFIGCYPCMKSFPYILDLENKFKEKGVHFIKLNPLDAKEPEKVIRYSKLHSIEKENYLIPRNLCSIFSVNAYPSFIFIEDGKIIKSFTGFDENVYSDLKLFLEKWTSDSR